MVKIEIYTTLLCPFCTMAKRLLRDKGVAFVEHNVTMNGSARSKMATRAGGRTSVPQIFVGGAHIGGCDDLHALDRAGGLDKILAPA